MKHEIISENDCETWNLTLWNMKFNIVKHEIISETWNLTLWNMKFNIVKHEIISENDYETWNNH